MIKATGKNFKGEAPSKSNMVRLSKVVITGSPIKSDKVADVVSVLPEDEEIALMFLHNFTSLIMEACTLIPHEVTDCLFGNRLPIRSVEA